MKEAAINQLATKKQQKGGFFSCFCIKGNINEAEEERSNQEEMIKNQAKNKQSGQDK